MSLWGQGEGLHFIFVVLGIRTCDLRHATHAAFHWTDSPALVSYFVFLGNTLVCCAKTLDKSNPERTGFLICLTGHSISLGGSKAGTQDKNLEVTEAEAMEEPHLPACFSSFLSLLSDITQHCCPSDGAIPSGLGLPTSSTNQENAPQTCYGKFNGDIFSIDVPLPRWL